MKKKIRRIILFVLISAFLFVAASGMVLCVKGYSVYKDVIAQKSVEDAISEIRQRDDFVVLSDMPKIYTDAVVSTEDRRFYNHGAADIIAIARAVIVNFKNGKLSEGGSTITQQVAKNMYFIGNDDPNRKIAELFVAHDIEALCEKDEILELYVNNIYFGSGYYSIYDASIGYFGKEPSELTPYESTMLAGLPNAPSVYSPDSNPKLAHERQKQVLAKMVRNKKISAEDADSIISEQSQHKY